MPAVILPAELPSLQTGQNVAQKSFAKDAVREGPVGEGPGTPAAVPLPRGTLATSTGVQTPRRCQQLRQHLACRSASCVPAACSRAVTMPAVRQHAAQPACSRRHRQNVPSRAGGLDDLPQPPWVPAPLLVVTAADRVAGMQDIARQTILSNDRGSLDQVG